MGRMVWFAPPLLASGFGVPAVVVVGGVVALVGAAYWVGKQASKRPPEQAEASVT